MPVRPFADIVAYPPQKYNGIISLQIKNHPEIIPRLIAKLEELFSLHNDPSYYRGKLFLVEVHRIRVRG